MSKQGIRKKKSRSNGRWTKTQHERFMKGFQRYGRDWVSVQKVVKTRTLTQIRSHAQKVFLKYTEQEINSLIAKDNQYQIPKYSPSFQNQDDFQSEVQVSELWGFKQNPKTQLNLVDIFMNAIEEQSRQPSCQHDNSKIIQQQETKLQNKRQFIQRNQKLVEVNQKQNENPQTLPLQKIKQFFRLGQQEKNFTTNQYQIRVNLQEAININ